MSDANRIEGDADRAERRLKDAIRLVRERQAEQNDAHAETQQAENARLRLLADELQPLFRDIDPADERFDISLSTGERPRLWIDMVAFVAIGHDRRTYRLISDTSAGRTILAESADVAKAGDFVGQYIAERVLERERVLQGDRVSLKKRDQLEKQHRANKPVGGTKRAAFWFAAGVLFSFAVIGLLAVILVPEAF